MEDHFNSLQFRHLLVVLFISDISFLCQLMLVPSFPRREDSLDVEVSASGYTKEMQADDELLHPVGPDDKITETEDESDFSFSDEEVLEKHKVWTSEMENELNPVHESGDHCCCSSEDLKQIKEDSLSEQSADVSSFEVTELNQALEEMKKEVLSHSSVTGFSEESNSTENDTRHNGQTGQWRSPAGCEECEDECPDLIALSSLNKEFRPFRYRFLFPFSFDLEIIIFFDSDKGAY